MNCLTVLPYVLPSVTTLPFSDGEVLFCPKSARVWVVNSTCAFIWHLLDLRYSYDSAVTTFSGFFNIPLDTAQQGIDVAIADFKLQGLLHGCCPSEISSVRRFSLTPLAGPPCCCDTWLITREFIIGHTTVTLCSQNREIASKVAELLEPLSVCSAATNGTCKTIAVKAVEDDPDKWNVYVDDVLSFKAIHWCNLLPSLLGLIYVPLFTYYQDYVHFHAAVAVRDGRALLLPAASGSGKSTLVATLATMGWTFFSDELAPVDAASSLVHSMLFPIAVKPGSVELLQQFYPELGEKDSWIRSDSKVVRYLCPPQGSLPKRQSAEISTIIFPEYKAGVPTSCEPLSKFAALQCLAETESSTRLLCEQDIQAMINVVENADCYSLGYSDLAAAIDVVERVFAAK